MGKIKAFFRNKWVGFTLASLLYTLWFVVWTGNLWLLLGLVVIFDLYISKYFYRYVWCHNVRLCERSKTYKTIYEWVNAIIFATVVASLVHIFIFQMYVIPTSSMERTLLIGDYLYVSKVSYGPQMPNTPLSFPFVHHTMPFSQTKKSFSEAVKWPYHRLKGLRRIKRNDVVVFNFPAGDTVLLENQAVTYYDVLRGYEESFGKEEGRKRLAEKYTIVSRPVDKRENYIKRCVAIAGDSLEVRDGQVWVNGAPQEPFPGIQYQYVVQVTSPPDAICPRQPRHHRIHGQRLNVLHVPHGRGGRKGQGARQRASPCAVISTRPTRTFSRSGRNRAGARTTTGRSGFRRRAPRCSSRPKTCLCTAASSKPTKGMSSKNATGASTSTAPRPAVTRSAWITTG